mgnify:CR=1 FL=1
MIGGWIASILGVVAIALACASPATAGPPLPLKKSSFPGKVVRLDQNEWLQLSGKSRSVVCDLRSGQGVTAASRPGTRLTGPKLPKGSIWFVPLNAQASEYLKRAKAGKTPRRKRSRLFGQATRLRKQAGSLKSTCGSKARQPRFKLNGATAIATISASRRNSFYAGGSGSDSGLLAWSEDQVPFDPVVSGQIEHQVADMFVAPDSDLILVLSVFAQSNACGMLRIDYGTGDSTCVARNLSWGLEDTTDVQFDSESNAYYWGSTESNDGLVFRMVTPTGVATDVIDPRVANSLQEGFLTVAIPFIVSPNGDILMNFGGKLRRIKPDGSVEIIASSTATLCGSGGGKSFVTSFGSMFSYSPGASSLDVPAWIGPPGSGATHASTDIAPEWVPGCFSVNLADGALIGGETNNGSLSLIEYFPTPRKLNYSGQHWPGSMDMPIASFSAAGSKVVVHRKDSSGNAAVDLYDHATNTTKSLVAPDGDLEISHMVYSPAENLIYFDGVNFESLTYFLGTIDPDTGERQYLDALNGDLGEILALG